MENEFSKTSEQTVFTGTILHGVCLQKTTTVLCWLCFCKALLISLGLISASWSSYEMHLLVPFFEFALGTDFLYLFRVPGSLSSFTLLKNINSCCFVSKDELQCISVIYVLKLGSILGFRTLCLQLSTWRSVSHWHRALMQLWTSSFRGLLDSLRPESCCHRYPRNIKLLWI